MNGPHLLSIDQVCQLLSIHRDTLKKWEANGKITPVIGDHERRYYRANDVLRMSNCSTAFQLLSRPFDSIALIGKNLSLIKSEDAKALVIGEIFYEKPKIVDKPTVAAFVYGKTLRIFHSEYNWQYPCCFIERVIEERSKHPLGEWQVDRYYAVLPPSPAFPMKEN